MNSDLKQLFSRFENTLFASASDEYNERASDLKIESRYNAAQVARLELIQAIEALEAMNQKLSAELASVQSELFSRESDCAILAQEIAALKA